MVTRWQSSAIQWDTEGLKMNMTQYTIKQAITIGILAVAMGLYGCGRSNDTGNNSEFDILRIYDPSTGTVSEPVTKAYLYNADWAPNGLSIVSDLSGVPGQTKLLSDIRLLDVAAGTLTNLTNSPDRDEHSPKFSPDGTKIIYISDNTPIVRTVSTGTLATLNATGTAPAWSPNSATIAYEGTGIRTHDLGTTDQSLTGGHKPLWLTNATVLIEKITTGNRTLYECTVPGAALTLFAEGHSAHVNAALSPVAVVYVRNGDVYRKNIGQTETLLIENAGEPVLSHDGTRIAFVRDGTVYVASIANLANRTAIGVGKHPRWSQTGKLVFEATVYR